MSDAEILEQAKALSDVWVIEVMTSERWLTS